MRCKTAAFLSLLPSIAQAAGENGNQGINMGGAVLQMLASLAVVMGVIYLLYYAMNRWFKGLSLGKGRSGRIRIVETRHLAPKCSLMIVEVAGEYLLLGNGSEGIRLIKTLEAGDDFESCSFQESNSQTTEVFLRKFNGMLDKALTGLQTVMENESGKKPAILKRDGGLE
jgi:flagellar protein FliO/FliZ